MLQLYAFYPRKKILKVFDLEKEKSLKNILKIVMELKNCKLKQHKKFDMECTKKSKSNPVKVSLNL